MTTINSFQSSVNSWNNIPKGQNYRWVLEGQNKSTEITVVPMSNFKDSQKEKASLGKVFTVMQRELSAQSTSPQLDKASLKFLRAQVVQKYDRYWDYRCIFARLLDLFLGLFKCSCSLTTSYKSVLREIDSRLAQGQAAVQQSASGKVAPNISPGPKKIEDLIKKELSAWENDPELQASTKAPSHVFVAVGLRCNGKESILVYRDQINPSNLKDFLARPTSAISVSKQQSDTLEEVHLEFISINRVDQDTYNITHRSITHTSNSRAVPDNSVTKVNKDELQDFLKTLDIQLIKLSARLIDASGDFV